MFYKLLSLYLTLCINVFLYSQTPTLGLIKHTFGHEKFYFLYTPLNSKSTFLLDDCGNLINSWTSTYTAGVSQELGPDGSLFRCGLVHPPKFGPGCGGVIEKFDWKGNITWTFELADSMQTLHHDIKIMPNGNILAIVWERKSPAEQLAKGKKPELADVDLWSERIIEIKPTGKTTSDIVWEWSPWDHVVQDYDKKKSDFGVPKDAPHLFDINFTAGNYQDWFHFNSVDYNQELDQIIVNAHSTDEFYIIDHSTTTVEAAGHSGGRYNSGGDILYRWGNPMAYGSGDSSSKRLFKQHHAHWIKAGYANAGKIMVFNNGQNRGSIKYSTIDIIDPPQSAPGVYIKEPGKAYGPTNQFIAYQAPNKTDFFAQNLSGMFSTNAGILITSGPQGKFFEVDSQGNELWRYLNPVNGSGSLKQGDIPTGTAVFRCEPYAADFIGFTGKDMRSKGPLEKGPLIPSVCEQLNNGIKNQSQMNITVFPNPVITLLNAKGDVPHRILIRNLQGAVVAHSENCNSADLSTLHSGIYTVEILYSQFLSTHKIIKE